MVRARGLTDTCCVGAGVAGAAGVATGVAGAGVGVIGAGAAGVTGAAAGAGAAGAPPSNESLVTEAKAGMSSFFSTLRLCNNQTPYDNGNRLTNIDVFSSLSHQNLSDISLFIINGKLTNTSS